MATHSATIASVVNSVQHHVDSKCGDYVKHSGDIASIVDTDLYPIENLDSPAGRACVDKWRAEWNRTGSVTLEGFIRRDVIKKVASEVSDLPSHRRCFRETTYRSDAAYGGGAGLAPSQDLPAAHPLNREFYTDVTAVAGDCIPESSLLRSVYDSPHVAMFFAKIMDLSQLHQYKDEFQGLNVFYMYDGSQRAWHYDGSNLVVTLMIQEPSAGGEFEFVPFIRGDRLPQSGHDERFAEVESVFDGTHPGLMRTRVKAGSLNLFDGSRSLHRVLATEGPVKRILSVLSYDTRPPAEQVEASMARNVHLYGSRVRELYEQRDRRAGVPRPAAVSTQSRL